MFEKSQQYGKDKARFSLVSSAYSQALEMGLLWFNAQVWTWDVAGRILARYGYGDYEVRAFL